MKKSDPSKGIRKEKTDSGKGIKNFFININTKSKVQLAVLFFVSLTVLIISGKLMLFFKSRITENLALENMGWILLILFFIILFIVSLYLSVISLIFFIRHIIKRKK